MAGSPPIADAFASGLILPHYLFKPLARQQKRLTFKTVGALADAFSASITATAIRLVEADIFPALVVCHGQQGRKWFARAAVVPRKWYPQDQLDSESFTFAAQFTSQQGNASPSKIGADAWFDSYDAERFEAMEQCIKTAPDETLTLITIINERMLEEDTASTRR